MSEKKQEKNVKKILLIISTVIAALIFITVTYAVVSKIYEINQKTTTGTVKIEDINLQIENKMTGNMESTISQWQPGDANILTWNTTNIGTAAIRTRQTIQIYWKDGQIGENAKGLLYLYPVNMSDAQILADFAALKVNAIETQNSSTIEIDGNNKVGISYTFEGDVLDGTERKGVAQEKSYDFFEYGEESFTTDETENSTDKLGFKILLNPDTSYLYQEKELGIRVITEVMQYTENSEGEWQIQSVKNID